MLGIGFKVTDTATSLLERPLREYIQREYAQAETGGSSSGIAPEHEEAINKFLQLRNDVSLVRTPSGISRHVLLRYYGQLERFAQRFPSVRGTTAPSSSSPSPSASTNNASTLPLRLQFTWNDSFCPRKKITQSNIMFEQAAVMFNYGALESQLGVQADRSSPDGLKASCKHFMLAAGAFTVVKDDLVDQCLGSRTPDMTPEALGMLIQLMLAQGQACFYEKSIKDQMKDAIKTKLACQALEFYLSALSFVNGSELNGTIDKSWSHHLQFQVHCMKAASQHWAAKAAKEVAMSRGIGYGEEIARLMAADAECQLAVQWATQNRLPASLMTSIKQLQRVVQETLASAKKDNASIYLENVPKFSDLPEIGKASMVKALVLTEQEIAAELAEGDLFEKFVPSSLLKQAAETKDEIMQLVVQATDKAQELNEKAKLKLHSLGLPASIEAFEKTEGLPQTLWLKIEKIQTQIRPHRVVDQIEANLRANSQAADTTERQLQQIERLLSQEEVDDNVCRQNYGSAKWTRPQSSELSSCFQSDVDKYYRLLREAKNSDKVVQEKLHRHQEQLELLQRSKTALDAEMPSSTGNSHTENPALVSLTTLLVRLSELIEDREKIVHDFVLSQEKFNALPALLAAKQTEVAATLTREKEFFIIHFVDKLGATEGEQSQLLDEIERENATFEQLRQQDPVLLQRERLIQQMSDAIDVYEQLVSNTQEGQKFYQDLALRVAQVFQTVQDHCAARELERKELELNFAQDTASARQHALDAEMAQRLASELNVSPSKSQFPSPSMRNQGELPPPPSYDASLSYRAASSDPFGGTHHHQQQYQYPPQQQQQHQQTPSYSGGYIPPNSSAPQDHQYYGSDPLARYQQQQSSSIGGPPASPPAPGGYGNYYQGQAPASYSTPSYGQPQYAQQYQDPYQNQNSGGMYGGQQGNYPAPGASAPGGGGPQPPLFPGGPQGYPRSPPGRRDAV